VNADEIFQTAAGANLQRLKSLLNQVGTTAPEDYIDWMQTSDGGEFVVGEKHVCLFPVDTIILVREEGEHEDYLPEWLAIGSDGGGNLLVLKRNVSTAELCFIDPLDVDRRVQMGQTLTELCSTLRESVSSRA
jgi:hypothetical protein